MVSANDLPAAPPPPVPTGTSPLHHLTCSDQRPVGACLSNYIQAWEEITEDQWVLDVLRNGYAPEFHSERPQLTRTWKDHESANSQNATILQEQVDSMILKNAIEEVKHPNSLGHYSNMFLVPKKNGKLRPVINLKPLNRTLSCPSFKMETVAEVTSAVRTGDWATSLDLTDGYFHIPIAPWFRKYLRFVVNGKVFQFQALPFGLNTAPLVFTRMLRPLSVHLHSRGVLLHRYLDDLLIRSQSRDECLKWTQELLDLLYKLGLGVNLEKSDLIPSQDFVYIGVRFMTSKGVIVPPQDRVEKIRVAAQNLIHTKIAPAQLWLSMIGLLSSAEKLVPLGRLRIRPIHFCLRRQFSIGVHSLSRPVMLDFPAQQALRWWMKDSNVLAGQSLERFQPQVTLYTDASLSNWGAHSEGFQASGAWTVDETQLSINCLELLAVYRALQASPPSWRDMPVMVATDNTTVVSYINCQGGTHSMNLMDLTYDLFNLTEKLGLQIRARHIPGKLNRTADLLSRSHQIVNTEWTLNPKVANMLWKVWGRPHLDLMATSLTKQLPLYVSPYPDPQALAVDAMSCSWAGMDAYIFPPWAMIGAVLNKALHQSCVLTLIAPRWPNRAWFPLLLQLLVDNPVQLPYLEDLIQMPHNHLLYSQIHSLDLHACRLSSDVHATKAFRARCPVEWQQDNTEIPLRTSMSLSGTNSCFGVSNGVLILNKSL